MRGSASRIFGVKTFPKIRLIQSNERGLHLAGESYVIITGSEAMNQRTSSKREKQNATTIMRTKEAALVATVGLAVLAPYAGHAEKPPPPCHPNLHANEDMAEVSTRGDIVICLIRSSNNSFDLQTGRTASYPHRLTPKLISTRLLSSPSRASFFSITCWTQLALSPIRLRLPFPVSTTRPC